MPRFNPLPAREGDGPGKQAAPAIPVDLNDAAAAAGEGHGRLGCFNRHLPRLARAAAPAAQAGVVPLLRPMVVKTVTPADHALNANWPVFLAALALIVVKFCNLTELGYFMTGVNLKLLYIVAPFAYIGVIFSSGLESTLRNRSFILIMLFFGWMVVATPFSSWVGGSTGRVKDYAIHMLPLVLVIGGTVITWKQLRMLFGALAMSAVVVIATVRMYGVMDTGGRLKLESSGTIGNSNDLAAHLLLLLPFVLYVTFDQTRNVLFRIASVFVIAYGVYVVLGTGSRGAVVAIAAACLFFLLQAPMRLRIGLIAGAAVASLLVPIVIPESTRARLTDIFSDAHEEAAESKDSREYLFKKSVEFTFLHPVFGVGPDQFGNYEGRSSIEQGKRGNWHATHCSWTQISSESGILAFLFFAGALGTAIMPVYRCYKKARALNLRDLSLALFCVLLSVIAFSTAATFLAQAYNFYFVSLIGLLIATARIAQRRIEESADETAAAAS